MAVGKVLGPQLVDVVVKERELQHFWGMHCSSFMKLQPKVLSAVLAPPVVPAKGHQLPLEPFTFSKVCAEACCNVDHTAL